MATSVGYYSDFTKIFSLDNPQCPWDDHEHICQRCEKKWIGGTTCFECNPNMLFFLAPRREYLEENEYTGDIPDALKKFWEKREVNRSLKGRKQTSVNVVSDIISTMREQSRIFQKVDNDILSLINRTQNITI